MAVEIVIRGTNDSSGALQQAAQDVREVGEAGTQSEGKLKGFFGLMGGAGLGAAVGLGAGLMAAAGAGLNFNNSVEQATARINAFTKDTEATTEILEMVKERAAQTPFAFEEMANAAAALGPNAKSSGVELEKLLETAEVLAASNPAEGLEGAAFAIKEALSGDFTSAIERFNLSRSYINELREQGVPDLEALSMAMQQAGYDTDLVSQLANTAQGRWSTFMDTWTNLAGMVTQPIFDAVSSGLGQANDVLSQFAPQMQAAAETVAGFISQAIAGEGAVGGLMTALQPVIDFLAANWQPIVAAAAAIIGFGLAGAIATAVGALAGILAAAAPVIGILAAIGAAAAALQGAWANNFGGIREATAGAMSAIQGVITAVLGVVQEFWAQNGAQIVAFTTQAWTQIQQIVGTVAAIIATVVSTVFGAIAGFMSAHGSEIQAILSAAWNQIQNVIQVVLDVIQGITTTVLGVLQGDWDKAAGGIQQIVEGLGEFISNSFENLKTLITNIGPGLLSAAQDVGQAIIDGLAGAISNGAGAIVEAAKNAAKAALDAAKAFLGIKSPSKVFADAVGLPIAQGIAQGVTAGAPLVAGATSSIAQGGVVAARQEVRTVNMGGITINQTPGERDDQVTRRTLDTLKREISMRRG